MPVEKEILVGIRGKTYIEAGYVYAPYIPLNYGRLFVIRYNDNDYFNYIYREFNTNNYPLIKIVCGLVKK